MVIKVNNPSERQPGPYAAGRVCDGCGAILSRSNPSSLCAPCRPDHRWPGVRMLRDTDDLRELLES